MKKKKAAVVLVLMSLMGCSPQVGRYQAVGSDVLDTVTGTVWLREINLVKPVGSQVTWTKAPLPKS